VTEFHTHGPVPIGSSAYVVRQFENTVRSELLANRWVLLLGPRQHGKTSALLRAKVELAAAGVLCATVDLQGLPPYSQYSEILDWIARRVAPQLGTTSVAPPDRDDLDAWLSAIAPPGAAPLAIFFDEASSIANDAFRNALFGQLRSIATLRSESPAAARIRCLFSGTFRPETLVDERNSPFNVCQRVETDDFTIEQTRQLAATNPNDDLSAFADQIYAKVRGQPYLTQRLLADLSAAEADARPEAIASSIDGIVNGDDGHCERLFSRVFEDERLIRVVDQLVRTTSVAYQPANADFRYLQVIGVARRETTSLVFRNDLYRDVAARSPQIAGSATAAIQGAPVLFALPPTAFDFMKSVELRDVVLGSHSGAVRSYNDGAYRLALAGFGCALEGILLDWLRAVTAPNLAAAVGRARHKWTPVESRTDPTSWRLVTMIVVGRELSTKFRPVEPPDVLREWRNLIHPAKALDHFVRDAALEPEARAASGLFEAFRRDVAEELS